MKLDSSLRRNRITEAISSGWPMRPMRGVGHNALHRLVGENVGHLGLDQAGSDAVDADIMRRERLGTAASQGDHTRLGGGVMDLHLPGPSAATDDTRTIRPNPRSIMASLTANTTRNAPFKIHVDRFEPEIVRQAGMVADVADRTAMGEQVDRAQVISRVAR